MQFAGIEPQGDNRNVAQGKEVYRRSEDFFESKFGQVVEICMEGYANEDIE